VRRREPQTPIVEALAPLLSAEEAQVRFLSRLGAEVEEAGAKAGVDRHRMETYRHVERVSAALKSIASGEEVRPVPELDRIIDDYDGAVKGRFTALDGDALRALARVERLEIELYEQAIDAAVRAGRREAVDPLRLSLADERRMLAEVDRLEEEARARLA
jgi:ferritin-like metal-binding protein YciE